MKTLKRITALILTVVLVGTMCFSGSTAKVLAASDVTVYVSETGNDDTGDGTQTNPYASLKEAYAYLYSVNGTSGTVDTNRIYVSGTVSVPQYLNNANASSGYKAVAATISGVDGTSALLKAESTVVRLYAATVLDNLSLSSGASNTSLNIRARSNALTIKETVTTDAGSGSITITGGDQGAKFTTTNLKIYGGTFSNVTGGSVNHSGTTVNIEVGGTAVIGELWGGTRYTSSTASSFTINKVNLSVNGGSITTLYMGGRTAHGTATSRQTITSAKLDVTGGTVTAIYAGGNVNNKKGNVVVKEALINISGGVVGDIYSGGRVTTSVNADNGSSVESTVITISGANATIGGIYGTGKTDEGAAGTNAVGFSKLIFDTVAGEQITTLNDVGELQMTASTVTATDASGIGNLVLVDNDSQIVLGSQTVNADSVVTITKHPESAVIEEEGGSAEMSVEVQLPDGVTGEPSYQWYSSLNGSLADCEVIENATQAVYTTNQELGILYYGCKIGVPTGFTDVLQSVSVYSGFAPVYALHAEEGVNYVYVSEISGSDENDGSFSYPLATMVEAYSRLDANGTVDANVIVVIDQVTIADSSTNQQKHNKPATIRGFLDSSTVNLGGTIRLYADTKFADVQISASSTTIRCRGNALTMAEGVRTTGTVSILGGDYHLNDDGGNTALATDPVIVIQSGTFGTIYGGGSNGRNGHLVFNSTIRVEGGTVSTIYAGHTSDTNSTDTSITPSNTSVENTLIEICGGVVGTVYGGGRTRTNVNANSTNVTNSVISVSGGKIGALYAGGMNYLGTKGSNTVKNSVITISGGKIGTLSGAGVATEGTATVETSRIVFQNAGNTETPIVVTTMQDAPMVQVVNSHLKISATSNVQSVVFYDTNSDILFGENAISVDTVLANLVQPDAVSAAFNESVALSVSASLPAEEVTAGELQYQWYTYRTGDKLVSESVESASAANVSVIPDLFGDSLYYCVIGNAGGSATANLASVVAYATDNAVVSVTPAVTGDKTVYVSTSGNDLTGNGSESNPWATIEAARSYIQENKGGITGNITVIIDGGVYRLDSTLEFDQNDSGHEGQIITYKAAENEDVVISGTKAVESDDFALYADGIYVAQIGMVDGAYPEFRDLLVNGSKVIRARTPNNGWNYFTAFTMPTETSEDTYTGYPTTGSGFYISETNTPELNSWDGVELVYNYEWQLRRLGVTGVEEAESGNVQLIINEDHYKNYATNGNKYSLTGCGYWLENHLSFLDEPGEWYYDQTSGKIYYYPYEDELTGGELTATVEYPVVEQLITITGTAEEKAENLAFDGLNFTGTTSMYATYNGFLESQGGYASDGYVFPGAVEAEDANNLMIQNCIFTALGNHCLRVHEGSSNVTIKSNIFENSAMGAIYIADNYSRTTAKSRYCTNVLIEDNQIFNIAMEYLGSYGITALRTVKGVYIRSNSISYVPYTAIAVGSGSTNNTSFDDEVYIEKNLIENAMYAISDGAGIYVRGGSPYMNHYIRENVVISNGSSASTRSVGIYLDCGVRNYKVQNNLVLGYKNVVMQIQTISSQRARNHVVTDNWFTLSKQIKGKEAASTGGNTVSNNVRYDSLAEMPDVAKTVYAAAGSGLLYQNELVIVEENKHIQIPDEGAQIHLEITNTNADSRIYSVGSYNMPGYIVLNAEAITIPAGETGVMTVQFSLTENAPESTGATPVALSIVDQYGVGIVRERAISVEVGVNTSNVIYKHTPTIDGIMDPEYLGSAVSLSGSPFYPSTSAVSDVTATVYLLWDDTYLYVYAMVQDSTIMSRGTDYVNSTDIPWKNDNIETYYSEAGSEDKVAVDAFGIACYESGFPRPDYPYATKFTYQGQIIDYTPSETVELGTTVPEADGYVIEMTIPITQGTEDGSVPTAGEQVYFFYQINDLQSLTQTESGNTWTAVALKNSPQIYVLSDEVPPVSEE